jgi:hypothetical protein
MMLGRFGAAATSLAIGVAFITFAHTQEATTPNQNPQPPGQSGTVTPQGPERPALDDKDEQDLRAHSAPSYFAYGYVAERYPRKKTTCKDCQSKLDKLNQAWGDLDDFFKQHPNFGQVSNLIWNLDAINKEIAELNADTFPDAKARAKSQEENQKKYQKDLLLAKKSMAKGDPPAIKPDPSDIYQLYKDLNNIIDRILLWGKALKECEEKKCPKPSSGTNTAQPPQEEPPKEGPQPPPIKPNMKLPAVPDCFKTPTKRRPKLPNWKKS